MSAQFPKLAEIEDALEKITPWPWETDRIAVRSAGYTGRQIALCEISVRGRPYDETYDEAIANAAFIANSPEYVAHLLSELKRVTREKDEAAERMRERCAALVAGFSWTRL